MPLELKGSMFDFLNCIGLPEGSDAIVELVAVIDAPFVREEVCYAEPEIIYSFHTAGCEFTFNQDGILEAIFLYIKPRNSFQSFQLNTDFISGISPNISKEDLIRIMKPLVGSPERMQTTSCMDLGYKEYHYIRYAVDNKFIHFEYLEDLKLNLITLFLQQDEYAI